MKHSCSKKIRDLKVKNLCVKNAKINNADIKSLNSEKSNLNYATINNLNVTSINGQNIGCEKNFSNFNSPIIEIEYVNDEPVKPVNPGIFNQTVWDQLWNKTLEDREILEADLLEGRERISNINNQNGCIVCPEEENIVPLEIFGIQSVPPVNKISCGVSIANQITQLISSIVYNFDITNFTENLAMRAFIILVQIGWLDADKNFQYEEIDLAIKQYGPSLNQYYGEKYNGSVVLPTEFIKEIVALMPNEGNYAAIQMVVYRENGLIVDFPRPNLRNLETSSTNGPVDTQFIGQSVGGQLQNANIYTNYNTETNDIVKVSTTFNLSASSRATQWVFGWDFIGPPPKEGGAGGYFGINTDDNGNFQFLGSIFNVALSANVNESYVTAIKFGGEGEGWSLRITPENISNFPVTLDTEYVLTLNRQKIENNETTWEFIITNVSNSQTINLGTINTSSVYSTIRQASIYQFSEYFGPGAPEVTCQTVPKSVITWTFPQVNDVPNSVTWVPWQASPTLCGEYQINPTLPNGPVVMTFGSV